MIIKNKTRKCKGEKMSISKKCISLLGLSLGILFGSSDLLYGDWSRSGTHYSYTQSSEITGSVSDGKITYTLSIGPPTGYLFKAPTTGNCDITMTANNVTGKKEYSETAPPTSAFSIQMSGYLTAPGEGGGPVTWDASVPIELPLYISPDVGVGVEVPFASLIGQNGVTCSWSGAGVSFDPASGESTTASASAPNKYTITATTGDGKSATALFVRLGAKFTKDNSDITELDIIAGAVELVNVVELPQDYSEPLSLTKTGTGISTSGSAPGNIFIAAATDAPTGVGSVTAKYENTAIANLALNILDQGAKVYIVPESPCANAVVLVDHCWSGNGRGVIIQGGVTYRASNYFSVTQRGANSYNVLQVPPNFGDFIVITNNVGFNNLEYSGSREPEDPNSEDSFSFETAYYLNLINTTGGGEKWMTQKIAYTNLGFANNLQYYPPTTIGVDITVSTGTSTNVSYANLAIGGATCLAHFTPAAAVTTFGLQAIAEIIGISLNAYTLTTPVQLSEYHFSPSDTNRMGIKYGIRGQYHLYDLKGYPDTYINGVADADPVIFQTESWGSQFATAQWYPYNPQTSD